MELFNHLSLPEFYLFNGVCFYSHGSNSVYISRGRGPPLRRGSSDSSHSRSPSPPPRKVSSTCPFVFITYMKHCLLCASSAMLMLSSGFYVHMKHG
jgi:hypothetical protein